jgi:RES domain-containing protein
MTTVYRITRRPYSRRPFDGEGAYRYGGRWSGAGTRLAYCSQHVSLAMIEYLIHIDVDHPPKDLVLASAEIPEGVSRDFVPLALLPKDWRRTPAPPVLSAIGERFVQEGRAAILIVPSVLAPMESNWLINPKHPDFAKIKVRKAKLFYYDPRFYQVWRGRN